MDIFRRNWPQNLTASFMNILSDFFDGHSTIPHIDLLVTCKQCENECWPLWGYFQMADNLLPFQHLVENTNKFWWHFEVKKYIKYRIYRGIRIKWKMESFNRLGKCVRKRDLYYAQFNFFSVLRYHQSSYHFSFSLGIIP